MRRNARSVTPVPRSTVCHSSITVVGSLRSTEWSSPVEGWPRPGTAESLDDATGASDGEPGTHRSPGVSSPVGPARRCAGDRARLPSPNPSANSVGGCRGRNGEPPHVATPHAVSSHARHLFHTDSPAGRLRSRRPARTRSVVLAGATAALTFSILPGTAAATPGEAATPQQATQLVADASHRLEVVTEELNTAKVRLEQEKAAVKAAEKDAAEAEKRLRALDGQ